MVSVDNQLLVASVEKGIYKMTGSGFEKIEGWSILENNVIHAIEKHQNKTYIFTKKNGVYVEEKGVLSAWNNPLNAILKTANINVAKFIKNNKLIIGTANKGVCIFVLDFWWQTISGALLLVGYMALIARIEKKELQKLFVWQKT